MAGQRVTYRPHILIVGDDVDLTSFLAEGLLLAGFWTSVVASSVQALELFRLRSFDLVLLDAALGGFGALELVRRLRGRAAGATDGQARTDVPLVVVAADVTETAPEAAIAAGVDEVIVAPLALETLAPRLHALVGAWRAAHPDRPWADQAALAGGGG